jgi:integrase/recombinase XerD
LRVWFTFLGDREPTREIAIEYRKHVERTFSPRTAARRFNTARAYYRWVGGDNVFQSIKSPARLRNATPTVPLDSTVDDLLAGAGSERDAAVIALLLNGLRASEVCSLRPSDFVWSPDFRCHIIRVTGKGNKERLVPANSETSQRVTNYLSISKRGTERLLSPLRGTGAMTRRQVTEALRRAAKAAGIPAVNPHALRHHFGTRVWRSSKNLLALQNLMGHESPVTTQVYVHMDLADVVAAVKTDPRHVGKEAQVEDYPNTGTGRGIEAWSASRAEQGGTGVQGREEPLQ